MQSRMSCFISLISIYLLLPALTLGNIAHPQVPTEPECSLEIGEKDDRDETHHRRMVSVKNLFPSCTNSRVIRIDIPHDGINRSFSMAKAKTTTRGVEYDAMFSSESLSPLSSSTSSYFSPSSQATISTFSYWVGEDPVDGSIFNYVQDNHGHISGSMVDLTNHNVLQFHNRNGKYMVTITASSDFPPEIDPEDIDEERTLMKVKRESASGISEATATPRSISIVPPRKSLSEDVMVPSFLHINTQTKHKGSRKLYDDNGGNLDIMVVWTASAECNAYGQSTGCTTTSQTEANMLALINLAVQETNDAYQASGINTELLLVHAYRHPTYSESSFGSSLSDIQSGSISGVHSNRATYGADIVALIIDDSQYCGLAYVGPRIDIMYSVTAWNCATGVYTFGHEVGHNLGCLHDRGTEGQCSGGGYNYGYRDPNANFRTVLAYNCASGQCDNNAGGGCTRIPRFSNPNFTYNGSPLGSSSIDNARAINDVRVEVAGYYEHISSPQTPSPTPAGPTPTGPTPTPPTPTPPTGGSCGNSVCEINEGEGCANCSSDCSFPTNCNTLTNYDGSAFYGPSSYGIVFDVEVARNLYFYELGVILLSSSAVKVYAKNGPYTSDLNNWDLVFDGFVQPNSSDDRDSITFNSRFYAASGSTVSFYVSYLSPGVFVFEGPGDVSNADVTLKSGDVLIEQFGNTLPSVIYSNYGFAESIKYDYALSATMAPTTPVAPTPAPVSSTQAPVRTPTLSPTMFPTPSPTLSPTSSPTLSPTLPPTPSPTPSPTLFPTSSPVTSPVSTPAPVSTPTSAPVSSTPAPVTSGTCNDSPFRIKVKKTDGTIKTRSCIWVGNKDTLNRCKLEGVASTCPKTCGACSPCIDGQARMRFDWNGNLITRDCTWVARKQTLMRCAIDGMEDSCRVTCNNC